MRKDLLTAFIWRNLRGGVCPCCGNLFEPNGTGPEPNTRIKKVLHWLLEKIPLDELLNEYAVPFHDWRCHIGAAENNLSFEDTTDEFKVNVADTVKYWVASAPSFIRRLGRRTLYIILLQYMDDVYSWAVGSTTFGREAYDANSCAVEGS